MQHEPHQTPCLASLTGRVAGRPRPLLLAVALLGAAGASTAECVDRNPLRNAYFGDLHIHTANSFDAVLFGNQALPDEAYAFAKGQQEIALAPTGPEGSGLPRTTGLERPLDFAAVTDHAEFLGETSLCLIPPTGAGYSPYDKPLCENFREVATGNEDVETLPPAGQVLLVGGIFGVPLLSPDPERLNRMSPAGDFSTKFPCRSATGKDRKN